MLKILRADDPIEVKQLVVALFGQPGIGKSTLGFTADTPILLDYDGGAYRAANRQDSVQVDSWKDTTNITEDDLKPYNTVVVDTVGRALDYLTVDIIARNPKMGNAGNLTLQGYGALKTEFTAWLKSLRTMGKDVVLIAHASEEKKGDDFIERLDVQGGSKNEIYKNADAMGRIYLANGKRTISFSPTDTAFGKNPGNLEPMTIPDVSQNNQILAEIMDVIKGRLNELTESQKERQRIVADWLAKIETLKTADDFNEAIPEFKKADSSISQIIRKNFMEQAEKQGLELDKKTKKYVRATA